MSSHFRNCPKHRKPLPCVHCAAMPTGVTAPVAPVLSKAALRAKKWRDKQGADFTKKEAERKQAEREEAERKQLLDEALESGQFPANLVALRKKAGEKLFLTDAPQGRGKITTGGYDATKLGKVNAAHQQAEGGNGVFKPPAKHTTPAGHGPDSSKPQAPSGYAYFPPKDVLVMRRFLQNCMDEKPMLVCLICQEQIAGTFSFEAAYKHLHDKHPDRFTLMMERVKQAQGQMTKKCTEDHEAWIEKYGKGAQKVYCGKCKKLLYRPPKPPKPGRSDKNEEPPKAV
jgi:hypothetical protein